MIVTNAVAHCHGEREDTVYTGGLIGAAAGAVTGIVLTSR